MKRRLGSAEEGVQSLSSSANESDREGPWKKSPGVPGNINDSTETLPRAILNLIGIRPDPGPEA